MEAAINSLQNATKAGGAACDWVAANNELDKLLRFITRHHASMLASSTPPAGHIPPAFLGAITELDDVVNETIKSEKSAKKKMPANKGKAINSIRQTLKKQLKTFETQIEQYKKDSEAYAEAYAKAIVPPKVEKKARAEAQEGEEDEAGFATVGRGGRQLNLTADGVFKTLKEIFEQRGRKNTDRAETIRILTKLLEVSETTYQRLRVLLALIPARLDYSTNLASIPHDSWVACLHEYDQLITILLENKDYVVKGEVEEYDDMEERTPQSEKGRVAIRGNVVSLLENLDNEFTKTLQHTDALEHGTEYIARLREEAPLYVAIAKSQVLFEREAWADQTARAVMRRLEHVYGKPDAIIDHFEAAVNKATSASKLQSAITPFGVQRSASELVHALCVFIYQSDAPLLRARAILAHIFNHAMHARYHQARDLLLMSHLHDTIQHADVATQIMYNRALMQLGLAAFRNGYIHDCQTILADMFQSTRTKELLAQAVQRYSNTLSPEQELIEKRRLLPFHMHLNIELLEAAYLTSCMLVEIPLLAAADTEDQKRRIASKTFKRYLDNAEKVAFMGPPDITRDYVIKASKALEAGEWERCRDLILSAKIWTLLDNVDDVKDMLARKIQEEGLRTYLFTYAPYYASLSLAHLADMFSLPQQTVTSIISRMIYTDEIAASLDQIDQVVVFHRVEQTEVQRLAQQLAERCVGLVEQNEKQLDVKLGSAPGADRSGPRDGAADGRPRQERRGGGARGGGRGRGFAGRGRGFNSGLGSQRRVAA
jgi:translation initiation factor 3 subunit C